MTADKLERHQDKSEYVHNPYTLHHSVLGDEQTAERCEQTTDDTDDLQQCEHVGTVGWPGIFNNQAVESNMRHTLKTVDEGGGHKNHRFCENAHNSVAKLQLSRSKYKIARLRPSRSVK